MKIYLNKYKTDNEEFSFSDAISFSQLNTTLEALGGNLSSSSELNFTLTNLEGVDEVYAIRNTGNASIFKGDELVMASNFYEFLKKKTNLLVDKNTITNRFIKSENIESSNSKLDELTITIDPTLEQRVENVSKELEVQKNNINTTLSPDQKEKYTRLQELEGRLTEIQSQIEYYQSEKKIREEVNQNIKKFTTEKDNISQMLKSVEVMINSKKELELKLESYKKNLQSAEVVTQLKASKVSNLNTKLAQSKQQAISFEEEIPDKKFKININIPLALVILNVFITLLGFIYSYSFTLLLIGTITSVILMFLYLASRFFYDSLDGIGIARSVNIQEPTQIEENAKQEEDPNTSLFINTAFANALNNELNILVNNINKNLNGKTYEELALELNNIDSLVKKEEEKLSQLNAKSITSDEYYKKRREADILKIERENIEYGLKLDPSIQSKIKSLTEQLKTLKSEIEYSKLLAKNFPVFILVENVSANLLELKNKLSCQLVLVKAK